MILTCVVGELEPISGCQPQGTQSSMRTIEILIEHPKLFLRGGGGGGGAALSEYLLFFSKVGPTTP